MNLLFVGDVMGRPGRRALRKILPELRQEYAIDFCITNGENAAGGKGITHKVARELFEYGTDVVTLGNHSWDNKDVFNFINQEERVIRPLNFPPGNPGRGYVTLDPPGQPRITVVLLQGRVFMVPIDCPFLSIDRFLQEKSDRGVVIVDVHGDATSEKVALGWFLDGRVSAVIGTHTHVQTADETILPKGTAYITDVGMTGPHRSVIGCKIDEMMRRFLYKLPASNEVAREDVKICAVVIKIEPDTGKATWIKRLRIDVSS